MWQSIITPSDTAYKRTTEKISQITSALENNIREVDDIGLLTGLSGVAVYMCYYNKYIHEKEQKEQKRLGGKEDWCYVDKAQDLLERVFDTINSQNVKHPFCAGLAGAGWTLEHLRQQGFIDLDTDEVLNQLDDFLFQVMMNDMSVNYYDYLHGAVGYGIYFLNRCNNEKTKKYLKQLVDELDQRSHRREDIIGNSTGLDLIGWQSTINPKTGSLGYNLSMSHGMASIVVFLTKMLEAGLYRKKVLPLLTGGVKYILTQARDAAITKNISCLPSWVCESNPSLESRLAWCYGDPGVGIALWQASRIMGNNEWEKQALAILLHSTGRRNFQQEGVGDPGLCHGAAGLAHCYNRMYHYTGLDTFKETALFWLKQTLEMATFSDGLAGYKTWDAKRGWQKETGILEGISGIGLALISATIDIEPFWDRSLLLS